eukprot:scaffold293830_cov30-Tisochrysis_lutea.AAC.2
MISSCCSSSRDVAPDVGRPNPTGVSSRLLWARRARAFAPWPSETGLSKSLRAPLLHFPLGEHASSLSEVAPSRAERTAASKLPDGGRARARPFEWRREGVGSVDSAKLNSSLLSRL